MKEFQHIERQAQRRLGTLDNADSIDDLMLLPSNRFEALGGIQRQYSIRINDRSRVCFRFYDGHAFDVEITDYH